MVKADDNYIFENVMSGKRPPTHTQDGLTTGHYRPSPVAQQNGLTTGHLKPSPAPASPSKPPSNGSK